MEENSSSEIKGLRAEASAWCRGKNGLLRLPLLFWFGYLFIKLLTDSSNTCSCVNVFAPINLAFHEMGHIIFSCFGKFMNILGGTLLECLMPFVLMSHFYRQRDFFAMAMCFGWFSTVLLDVARYVADARSMAIPLVSLSWEPSVIHDWYYLLNKFGLLSYDGVVAFFFRAAAITSMGLCLGLGGWLIWRMITARD